MTATFHPRPTGTSTAGSPSSPAAAQTAAGWRGPRLHVCPVKAAMLTLVPLTYPVASLLTEARQLLNGSAAWDGTGDPTGAVVLLVLALALTLVPLMVGRAVARRSALPAMAALITVGAVTVGYCLQALLAI